MILNEAAVTPEDRTLSVAPKPLQSAGGYLEIGRSLIGVEERRTPLGAVGSLDFVVVHMLSIPMRGGRRSADRDTGHAGRGTA